jgi:hypothetical protein
MFISNLYKKRKGAQPNYTISIKRKCLRRRREKKEKLITRGASQAAVQVKRVRGNFRYPPELPPIYRKPPRYEKTLKYPP